MPAKAQTHHVKRLEKGLRKNKERSRAGRTRKDSIRPKSGGHPGGTLADERRFSPIAKLMGALQSEGIRFQVIGMSAAIIQGVPGTTNDIDLWIDLPPRDYMRTINVALKQGAEMVRNTVVALSDQTLVNFVYEVTGLRAFATELRRSRIVSFHGVKVPVLPLESIRKSKLAVGRPKDFTHIQQIETTLKCRKADRKRK